MSPPRVHLPLNLASEPFRRDRPILAASAATAVLMLGVLGVLVMLIVEQRELAADSRAQAAAVEGQLRAASSEQAQLEARLRLPGNAEVLDRSALFNALILRKSISWTLLFSDLERVMPGNVRLITVRPFLSSSNEVQLDMVVGAQSPDPVIELLKRLERSPSFGATSLLSSSPPTQNEPLYRYRVSVSYAQKL
jgi:type IV pilus assembly protein PilN